MFFIIQNVTFALSLIKVVSKLSTHKDVPMFEGKYFSYGCIVFIFCLLPTASACFTLSGSMSSDVSGIKVTTVAVSSDRTPTKSDGRPDQYFSCNKKYGSYHHGEEQVSVW